MGYHKISGLLLILMATICCNSCGPLLGHPPDDSEPTEIDLYGEVNTITINIQGLAKPIILPTAGNYQQVTIPSTDSIPEHTILTIRGQSQEGSIRIDIYEDGKEVEVGGYDGASSLFSLDGLIYYDLQLGDKRYSSLIYGAGAGGTTIYYDSFFTIANMHAISYQQAENTRKVLSLQGRFNSYLKEDNNELNEVALIIDGRINYKANY